ncbi:MAG: hypothetical protein IJV97_03850 [Alphaproteobacteria bacterium]|nr:hypothetical protein [Alphaproteobacteria bacterium]
MEKGVIINYENFGIVIVATVKTEVETKQVFASLESMSSICFDDLLICNVGDEIEFMSSYNGDEYGEELEFINILV